MTDFSYDVDKARSLDVPEEYISMWQNMPRYKNKPWGNTDPEHPERDYNRMIRWYCPNSSNDADNDGFKHVYVDGDCIHRSFKHIGYGNYEQYITDFEFKRGDIDNNRFSKAQNYTFGFRDKSLRECPHCSKWFRGQVLVYTNNDPMYSHTILINDRKSTPTELISILQSKLIIDAYRF